MPTLSPLELLMVGVIALVVFGPQKLPQIARTVGRAMSELRRMASDVRSEFESGLSLDDEPDEPEDTTTAGTGPVGRWVAEKPEAADRPAEGPPDDTIPAAGEED